MGCEKRNMKINKALFQRNICTVLFFGCLFCSSMYLFEMYNGFVSGIMLLFFSAMLYVFGTKSFVKKFFIQYLFVIGTIILSMFFNKSFESINFKQYIVFFWKLLTNRIHNISFCLHKNCVHYRNIIIQDGLQFPFIWEVDSFVQP